MYKAPSSDQSLQTISLPFNVILEKVEIVFGCLVWEWHTF